MKQLNIVILAAGKGERMLSTKPKVMHEIMGKPMIGHVIERAKELSPEKIIVVLGFGRKIVEAYLKHSDILIAVQKEQKGTAHALLSTGNTIKNGDVLVLYGDVPLIETDTLRRFLDFYGQHKTIAFLTTNVENPAGYGRVISKDGKIRRIVEDTDATKKEKEIKTINTGICIIPEQCVPLLKDIRANNKKDEYYLTDICAIAAEKKIVVRDFNHPNPTEVLGVNSRRELLESNITLRERIVRIHLEKGVTLLDRNVYIDSTVTIGRDTLIYPNCYLLGKTTIGSHVTIGPNVTIKDSVIADNTAIESFVVMEGASVAEGVRVGPFSRIRPSTTLKMNVRVGNFVEIKNSTLSEGAKANHLSYIGDAEVGRNVNIGAGTITCNYDGATKSKTTIEDNVFVGSNTAIVAPVTIRKGASIGAGSTITKEVPEDALAVTRAPQRNIADYKRRAK